MQNSSNKNGEIDFRPFFWLVAVEAMMRVHKETYPSDRYWRKWIRGQELPPEWYEKAIGYACAVTEGKATRFLDPGDLERI